jgi:hypothetical protein
MLYVAASELAFDVENMTGAGFVGKRGRTRRVVVEGEVAVIEETESLLLSCFIRYWRRRKM